MPTYGRSTQEPVESTSLPTSATGRSTQQPVESASLPTIATARATQEVVEIAVRFYPRGIWQERPLGHLVIHKGPLGV